MANKIILASDSTTDLSPELIERYNIRIIPLIISLGGKDYIDGVEITPPDIYEHNEKTGELPKTSACNIERFTKIFTEFTKDGDALIFFSLGSDLSSSCNNARIAAESFENVYVVDTKNLSTGGGLLVVAAAEMVKSGMSAEDTVAEVEKLVPCVDASFVIDNLDYLHQGGRCSSLAVLGANLLKLKPCIEVKDGVMGVAKKYRGNFPTVAKQYAKERLCDVDDIITDRVFVTDAYCKPEIAESVLNVVKESGIFKEVFVTKAGSTVCSHCGSECLGVLFIRKSPHK